ncbi:MAG: hypothetical protein HFI70_11135 [Lachnospiraceae bacterium]|nr:hypothetical protein [Lachnospiraceae bacterium]
MKLIDLVKAYKGNVKFDVNIVVDDETKDVIVFTNAEMDAVKDEIINGKIVKFFVSAYINNIPTINVIIKPEEKAPSSTPETGEVTEPKEEQQE